MREKWHAGDEFRGLVAWGKCSSMVCWHSCRYLVILVEDAVVECSAHALLLVPQPDWGVTSTTESLQRLFSRTQLWFFPSFSAPCFQLQLFICASFWWTVSYINLSLFVILPIQKSQREFTYFKYSIQSYQFTVFTPAIIIAIMFRRTLALMQR